MDNQNVLEMEISKMQKNVDGFVHGIANALCPDVLLQIAERLKNIPEHRKDVLLLHEIYNSEINIKLQSELLRMRIINNPEKLRSSIRGSRSRSTDESAKSIKDILGYATYCVTARFLNEYYTGLNRLRMKIINDDNLSIESLKRCFEDDVILNKSLSPIAWLNEHLLPIQITGISSLWQKVYIHSNSYADALLFGYLSELLFNSFKYCGHDKHDCIKIDFSETVIENETYLIVSFFNAIATNPFIPVSGKGLDAMRLDLCNLNGVTSPNTSLLVTKSNETFKVTLSFKKDLLLNDSVKPVIYRKKQ